MSTYTRTRTEYIRGLRRYPILVVTPKFGRFIEVYWAKNATLALAKAGKKWTDASLITAATEAV